MILGWFVITCVIKDLTTRYREYHTSDGTVIPEMKVSLLINLQYELSCCLITA